MHNGEMVGAEVPLAMPPADVDQLPTDFPWSLGYEPGHGYDAAIYYAPYLVSRSIGRTAGEAVRRAVANDRRRARPPARPPRRRRPLTYALVVAGALIALGLSALP